MSRESRSSFVNRHRRSASFPDILSRARARTRARARRPTFLFHPSPFTLHPSSSSPRARARLLPFSSFTLHPSLFTLLLHRLQNGRDDDFAPAVGRAPRLFQQIAIELLVLDEYVGDFIEDGRVLQGLEEM